MPKRIPYWSILLAFTLITVSCKNTQPTDSSTKEPQEILVLLDKGFTPSSLSILKDYTVLSQKRTSRSQNLWLLKLDLAETKVEELIESLKKDQSILEAYLQEDSENSNLKNNKKGTSNPNNKN